MAFMIRMGIPEMEKLWNRLREDYKSGTINKRDASLYKKWGKALKLLSENPRHPSNRIKLSDMPELSDKV